MTSPDSNDDATSSKYHIQIGEGQGFVIGDNPQVVQQFYGTPLESQVDLTAAEATYRQKVVDAYKWLNFSGFDTPDLSLANVPLEEVFVRLTLAVEKVIREPIPSEKVSQTERGERQQRERVITVQEPIELGQALGNHLLIVGEPGAGKSTLLRWLAVTFAQGRQREPNRLGPSADDNRLPVLVELGRLPDHYLKPEGGETPNWIQFLPEYLTTEMAFTNTPPQLLTRALADGRCLLLFDGLDEVADRQARSRLARSLVELARLFPGNRVIIGSRPAGVSESEGALRPQFQRCQIERFTPEDVQRFFRFWYALDRGLTPEQQRDAADTLYARVQATPATLQLATTPLLSTILVLIWRNERDLPERRVELYERCCRVLIERWEASHDVAYQGALVGMDWEDHLRLLTPLAYTIHSQEQRTSATREELVPRLAQALQTAGYANEQAAATREAKQFLDALGLRSGLLQYMGDDRYGFPHQTFQEYLAARYIAAQPDPEYIDLVMTHLHEAWWQEVHLLTIAHLGSGNMGASKASEDIHMGSKAEIIAEKFRVTREEQDRYSLQSHQKAAEATAAGRFKEEIVPVEVKQKKGMVVVEHDEPIRGDSSMDALAKLMPAFQKFGSVTAGNAPGLSDGASATVVAERDFARAHGLTALARITGYASAAITPRYIFAAPTRAVKRLLERTGMKIGDFDLIEVNEAFAAQTLANGRELDWDWSRVNVNGGAIALGHPIGSSGSRVLITLIHELRRRGGGRGLATLCLGGGGAVAMSVEV